MVKECRQDVEDGRCVLYEGIHFAFPIVSVGLGENKEELLLHKDFGFFEGGELGDRYHLSRL